MPYYYRLENENKDKHAYYPTIPESADTDRLMPVAKSLDCLFTIIPHEDILKLQDKGYKIYVYHAFRSEEVGGATIIRRKSAQLAHTLKFIT